MSLHDLAIKPGEKLYVLAILIPKLWDGVSSFCVKILSKEMPDKTIQVLVKEGFIEETRSNILQTTSKDFLAVLESEIDRGIKIMGAEECGIIKKVLDVSHIKSVDDQIEFIRNKFSKSVGDLDGS